MKRVAVLLSCYNGEKYFKEQIDSILNQKIDCELTLIIRDDGSRDQTLNILEEYSGSIVWYKGENLGAGYSFIKMIQDNPGYDYYAFSDQDDSWNDYKIQRAINQIKDKDIPTLYFSNAEMCDSNLGSLGRNVHKSMKYFNRYRVMFGLACAQGCTCVFNERLANIIQKNEMPKKIVLHDSLMTCLCYLIDGCFVADEDSTMKYRIHGNNIGGMLTVKQSNVLRMIKKRIAYIKTRPSVTITTQLEEILKTYGNEVPEYKKRECKLIISTKNCFIKRLKYGFSFDLTDETLNLSFANRIKILIGNY